MSTKVNPLLDSDPFKPPSSSSKTLSGKKPGVSPASRRTTSSVPDNDRGPTTTSPLVALNPMHSAGEPSTGAAGAGPSSYGQTDWFGTPMGRGATGLDTRTDLDVLLMQADISTPPPLHPQADHRPSSSKHNSNTDGATPNKNRRKQRAVYTREGDLCWDDVTQHHCLCFPAALDGVYEGMNDTGFSCCSMSNQMIVFGVIPALWPLYYACCCAQSYVLRSKFNTIIDAKEDRLEVICSAICCPCVITAQVHREIELRGKAVWTSSTCCCCGNATRTYKPQVAAPAVAEMSASSSAANRRLPPFLVKQAPFGGGVITASPSGIARNSADTSLSDQEGKVQLPVVTTLCGKPVLYNSWRHAMLLFCGLACDLPVGVSVALMDCCLR